MRTTVEQLIRELQTCEPGSEVRVSSGFDAHGDRTFYNYVARIDKTASRTDIIVERGA